MRKPEFAQRIKAVVHMDMVGGNAAITKSIFHVTRGPMSLPSFVYDVGAAFGEFVNQESALYAGTGEAAFPFVAPEGGKEALQAEMVDYSMGSDHDVYEEGAFRIPAIYMNDYPDRYIHTNGDMAANIDPTKLKRAAFIGAASGYFLAQMGSRDSAEVVRIINRASLLRTAQALAHCKDLTQEEADACAQTGLAYENEVIDSVGSFADVDYGLKNLSLAFGSLQGVFLSSQTPGHHFREKPVLELAMVYERTGAAKGPMGVFGYDYFTDHFGAENSSKLALLSYQGLRGSGGEYEYEALNFVNGKRNVQEIRDGLSAEYGPVPVEMVAAYLRALESIGVIKQVK